MTATRTLIVPFDGSELSEAALPWTVRLAQAHALDLVLMEAVDRAHAISPGGDEAFDDGRMGTPAYLIGLRERLAAQGVPVEVAVCHGDPARTILDLADERGAYAVCMTTDAHGGITRLLHDSVADRVLHDSTHPVLLVPARASESGRVRHPGRGWVGWWLVGGRLGWAREVVVTTGVGPRRLVGGRRRG
jgi:nucleotide-binding universal stress UspA family protein